MIKICKPYVEEKRTDAPYYIIYDKNYRKSWYRIDNSGQRYDILYDGTNLLFKYGILPHSLWIEFFIYCNQYHIYFLDRPTLNGAKKLLDKFLISQGYRLTSTDEEYNKLVCLI